MKVRESMRRGEFMLRIAEKTIEDNDIFSYNSANS